MKGTQLHAESPKPKEPDAIAVLCRTALDSTGLTDFRGRVLALLRECLHYDAAIFHELSPRVPLESAAMHGVDPGLFGKTTDDWDEMAVQFQPLLDVALRQEGAATDDEAFPLGSRIRRNWERRFARPLGIRGLLIGHLTTGGRIISGVVLLRRKRGFTRGERHAFAQLLPCLTLGDSYWQNAEKRAYSGLLTQPICRDQRLTPRQRQIVEGVALGRTNWQIAETLGVSPNTVRNLLAQVCQRLEAANRADVVRLAVLSAA